MSVFEISSFQGGLADADDKGIKGSFKFASNIDIRKQVDSLSAGQGLIDEGLASSASPSKSPSPSASISSSPSLSPSPSPSTSTGESPSPSVTPSASISASPSVTPSASRSPSPSPTAGLTTVFEGLIHFFVKCSNGYTYGFDNTGCIYCRDADAFWQRVYKDGNGSIKGAEEKPSSSGKTYLYWATNTQLNRKELPGLSSWNDVEIVAMDLQPQDWHTMKQIGGALKICNGPYLALVGYDDSYTNEALDLIPGNYAKTLVERNGRVIVGTYKAADPNKGVNAAIDAEVPLAQVGDDGDIYFADGVNTIPVKRLPGGGKVNPGGVTNLVDQINFFEWEETALSWIDKQEVGNMSLWGVFDADSGKNGIYTYGRKNKNKPFVLNLEYLLDADEIGAVTCVDGVVLASYQEGTGFGVKAVDSTSKAIGTYEALDFKAPVKKEINITQWKTAEVLMAPLTDGANVAFFYKLNKTGDWTRAYTASGSANYDTVNGKKGVFTIAGEGEIFSHELLLSPNGNVSPEIFRIRVFFD